MTTHDLINAMTMPELILQVIKLHEEMAELRAENERLRAENEELKRNRNRTAAPFSKGKAKKKGMKAGRKPGEGKFEYRGMPAPEAITEAVVEVKVEEEGCPACRGELEQVRVEMAYRTEIPVEVKPEVTAYRIEVCRCRKCGQEVRGKHPEVAKDQRGATAHRMGERVMAVAHTLHYEYGIPLRKVPGIMKEMTGVAVTQGALTQDAQRRAKGEIGVAYQELRAGVKESRQVHTDDTGWRVEGETAYLMVFETEAATVYQIRDRHRNEEVREVIPGEYPGTMITDRGRSYDAVELSAVKQQKCLAHILRSIAEVLATKVGPSRTFGIRLKHLLQAALEVWRLHRRVTLADFEAQAAELKAKLTDHLRDRKLPDADNQRLLNELGRHHDAGNLVRFLDDPTLEPTNNRAERALRPAVIARKVSHCSKNEAGARTFEAFKSVTQTLKQTGRSVVDGLYDLFRRHKLQAASP